ncbi:MAG: hypothetical protein QGG40_19905, partial [Myxococcota bacterium]|nr:hypothetical protein [Myxococcota bacterium]
MALAASPDTKESVQVVRATGTIEIDGQLNEPDWLQAQVVDTFLQYSPTEGGPPPGSTEFRFLQDERHLYIGMRVSGVDYPLRARVVPREDISADDQLAVYLDTFRDTQSGYMFWFNPLGIQQDIRYGNGDWNQAWNTV